MMHARVTPDQRYATVPDVSRFRKLSEPATQLVSLPPPSIPIAQFPRESASATNTNREFRLGNGCDQRLTYVLS